MSAQKRLLAAGLGVWWGLAACSGERDAQPVGLRDAGADAASRTDEDAGERDAAIDAAVPAREPVCSADGFCWEQPLPQGETLRGAWAASARDVWLVGDDGHLLHWDGVSFRAELAAQHAPLRAVHGSAPDDVWAVGDGGVLLHYDGSSWQRQDASALFDASAGAQASLRGVYAAGKNDVWAVGFSGVRALIAHYDGSKWQNQLLSVQSDQVLHAITGLGARRAWAVGPNARNKGPKL